MVFKARITNKSQVVGDTQIRRKFAFLPFRIRDDLVWLEDYEILQMYILTEYQSQSKGKAYQVYEWKNVSYRIIPKITINIDQK